MKADRDKIKKYYNKATGDENESLNLIQRKILSLSDAVKKYSKEYKVDVNVNVEK